MSYWLSQNTSLDRCLLVKWWMTIVPHKLILKLRIYLVEIDVPSRCLRTNEIVFTLRTRSCIAFEEVQ